MDPTSLAEKSFLRFSSTSSSCRCPGSRCVGFLDPDLDLSPGLSIPQYLGPLLLALQWQVECEFCDEDIEYTGSGTGSGTGLASEDDATGESGGGGIDINNALNNLGSLDPDQLQDLGR